MPEVTEQIVATEAGDLAEGERRYTPRQLYYAVCASVEVPQYTTGQGIIGCGVIGLVAAAFFWHDVRIVFALVIVGSLLIAYGMRTRATERVLAKAVRPRALGYDDFVRRFIKPDLPGLIDVAAWRAQEISAGASVLVCDSAENAALAEEVLRQEGLEAVVIDAASLPPPAMLVAPNLVAVHDASYPGCAVVADINDAGHERVVDACVRPQDVDGRRLQIIEGAPGVRPPRDLSGVLTPAELMWLGTGKRLDLAALPRDEIAAALRAALNQGSESDATTSAL